jgi:hypothetical protein
MKRYFLLFGSLLLLVFFTRKVAAQTVEGDVPQPRWSAAYFGSFQYTTSAAMQGQIADYETALAHGKAPAKYPFANQPYAGAVGFTTEHRFEKSPIGIYFSLSVLNFNEGNGFRNSPEPRFSMSIFSTCLGIQYIFGQVYQTWNFYGRLGFVPSSISSTNRSTGTNRFFTSDSLRNNTLDTRQGLEFEIGERYHFLGTSFGIEASLNYTNVNLFGKSYTKPVLGSGSLFNVNNSINDGKDPSDPNDNARVIDYFSVRIGARYYF